MDKLICEKDYKVCSFVIDAYFVVFFQETQKTCSDCGEAISGSYYTLDNEKVVCEKDYKVGSIKTIL
jgi:formylmethanofuran dehydrogenase subunit E